MVARKFSIVLVITLSSCNVSAEKYDIALENHLSNCIKIVSIHSYSEKTMPFVKIEYKTISSTASCGCKSALSSYSVFARMEEHQSFLIGGKLSFEEREAVILPLSVDPKIIANRPIGIVFSCSQPD